MSENASDPVVLPAWVGRWILPLILPVGLSGTVSGAGYLASMQQLQEQVQNHERLAGHPILTNHVDRIESDLSTLRVELSAYETTSRAELRDLQRVLQEVSSNQRAICLALKVDCRR